MEKLNLNTINQEDSNIRKKRILALASNQEILRLFQEKKIPSNEIDKHPYRLERYLEGIEKCRGCKGLSHCKQRQTGYYESLTYNRVLEDELVKCRYAREKQQAEKHLQNYLVNDLGSDFHTVSFQTVNLEDETKTYLRDFAKVYDAFENAEGVYLYGSMGSGKTYLAACATNDYARSHHKVSFVHCPKLAQRLSSNYHYDEVNTEVNRLMYSDLVVFDDIGAEEVSEKYRRLLLSILDSRMQNHKMTWFTSNEDHQTLLEHYIVSNKGSDKYEAMRIIERIQALSKPIQFITNDRRHLYQTEK